MTLRSIERAVKRVQFRLAIVAMLAVWASSPAAAQERTGRIRGRIVGDGQVPLAGAAVTVSGTTPFVDLDVRSDENGYFVAYALLPAEYRIRLRAVGFREVIVERVAVRLGQATSLGEIGMRRSAVVLAPVVVKYDAAAVDPLSTAISTSLSVRDAEALPVGRDYTSLLQLMPQVLDPTLNQEGLNIAGGTGFENAFYLDGVNVTEPFLNGGGISLPPTFIDHVELKTGGYEPEFGRASGGIVSMTTRSGANLPWQSAFAYYTASSLASNGSRSAFDFATGRFARYDVGAAVAGPIVRDRLWYFAAYDAAFAREDVRMPGGAQADDGRADRFAAKLTWRAGARTNVSATVAGDPSRRDMVGSPFWGLLPVRSLGNADPFLSYWDRGGVSASIAASRTLGTRWLLEASASRTSFRDRTGPRTDTGASAPLVIDFVTNEWSGGHGNQWDRRATRWAGATSASWVRGEHTAKIGVQFEDTDQREDWQWLGDGPEGAGVIFRTGAAEYLGLVLDHQAQTHLRIPTVFAQTSILAHRRLRVNGGLRWEEQRFSSPTTGRSSRLSAQLQPRLGVIVYPTGSTTQNISASVGRFYEQLPSQPITWYWGGLKQRFFFYDHDPRVDPSGGFPIAWDDVPEDDIKGQHYDEATLGYERTFPRSLVLAVRASHRRVREVLQEIERAGPPTEHVLANPGRGEFAELPKPNTRYDALEITLSRLGSGANSFMLSYVLSRHSGNYVGVRDQDSGNPNAQTSAVTDWTGLLPNDRTHVLKAFGAWQVLQRVVLGGTLSVLSGTPLSDFGKRTPDPGTQYFLSERGSAGRTPLLWDANLRATYTVPNGHIGAGSRVVVDVLHAFSQRKPIVLDQIQYLAVDEAGNPTTPNPFHGSGLQFQPPMTLRFGLELGIGRNTNARTAP